MKQPFKKVELNLPSSKVEINLPAPPVKINLTQQAVDLVKNGWSPHAAAMHVGLKASASVYKAIKAEKSAMQNICKTCGQTLPK
jgi:hypothetical protein